MKKKLIAVAIATAFAAPAFADNSNVTIYGRLDADFENVRTSVPNVAATPSRFPSSLNRVSTNATRLGVKGTEDLGDGLNAIWQLEIQADLNGNSGNGFGNGTRNSNVGLKGTFGTAFLGIWDTPFKTSRNKVELFDNTTFASAINVMGRLGQAKTVVAGAVTDASDASVSFNNRLKNSFQYWTPEFSGFQAKVAYGTDNAKTGTTNSTVASLSATYENDMFYAAYGYENFNDLKAGTAVATAGDKVSGNRLVGAYKFSGGLVGLTYERLNSSSVTPASNGARTAWELTGKYSVGPNNFGLSYVRAGDLGANLNTGANQVSLRYGYSFSKRTELYGMYTALSNKASAGYNLSGGNAITGSQTGAKLSGFGVGLIHSF